MNKVVLWEKSDIYSKAECISFHIVMLTYWCQQPSFIPFNNSWGWGNRRGLQSTVKANLYCAKTSVMLGPEDFGVKHRGRSCWSECFIGGELGKSTKNRTTYSVLFGGYVWPSKHCINLSVKNHGFGSLHISSATASNISKCRKAVNQHSTECWICHNWEAEGPCHYKVPSAVMKRMYQKSLY